MAVYPATEAHKMVVAFESAILEQVLIVGNHYLQRAQKLATSKFMVGGAAMVPQIGGMRKIPAKYTPPLSPPGPLRIRSGGLRRTVKVIRFQKIERGENPRWAGGLQAGDEKHPYAAAHEFGVRTRPHVIVPVRAKILAWSVGTKLGRKGQALSPAPKKNRLWVYAQKVNHPGSDIPARPFATPSLAEVKPQLLAGLEQMLLHVGRRLGL